MKFCVFYWVCLKKLIVEDGIFYDLKCSCVTLQSALVISMRALSCCSDINSPK